MTEELQIAIAMLELVYAKRMEQLESINAELLGALIMLVADYEEMGGADIYPDALKQAKQAICHAEEQA